MSRRFSLKKFQLVYYDIKGIWDGADKFAIEPIVSNADCLVTTFGIDFEDINRSFSGGGGRRYYYVVGLSAF